MFGEAFKQTDEMVWIDVKGNYNVKNELRIFSIIQKVVYDKRGIYVNKVVPAKLFEKTFVPLSIAFNKRTMQMRKPFLNCKLLKEIICKK
jgi:hypothetical protein